jgi:hypothetical protein
MTVIKVKWTVEELDNVLTLYDVQKVYRATSETGTYSEITTAGTRVSLVADQPQYYYDDTAGDVTSWYKISYYNSTTTDESLQSTAIPATGGGRYVTVQNMRDEGVTVAQASDAKLLRLIGLAESYFENATGRWFYPRNVNIRMDGPGSRVMGLEPEIIQIDTLEMLWEPYGVYPLINVVDLDGVVIYNRHLTQGLLTPDDREDPKLALEQYAVAELGTWPRGKQNISITGWFGYTELSKDDPIGETAAGSQVPLSKGRTPPLVVDAVMRLVVRYLPEISDTEAANELAMAHRLQRVKTRDQEIRYSAGGGSRGGGWFTGDRFIDDTIGRYMGPAGAEAA